MASVEDATPAKAEAAVQIWPGPLPATVTHFPAGLYLEGSGRTPPEPRTFIVTLRAYSCEPPAS